MADQFQIMEIMCRRGHHPVQGDFVLISYRLKDDPQPWRQIAVLPEEGQTLLDIERSASDIVEQLVLSA